MQIFLKTFEKATGLGSKSYLHLFEFVEPNEHWKNVKFYDNSNSLSEAQLPFSSSTGDSLKSGRKSNIRATNKLFFYLAWIQNGIKMLLLCKTYPGYLI